MHFTKTMLHTGREWRIEKVRESSDRVKGEAGEEEKMVDHRLQRLLLGGAERGAEERRENVGKKKIEGEQLGSGKG